MTKVLFLGATGYVGGSFLVALKAKYPNLSHTILVRSQSAVLKLSELGFQCVVATSAEPDSIIALAAQADIIINAADSDDVELTEAILKGLTIKHAEGRGVGALLHTSGTCLFLDGNKEGKFDPNGKVWDDGNIEDIKSLTASMLHGPVDIQILKAGESKAVNTFIVCPSVIYGIGSGPGSKTSAFYKYFISSILNKKHGYVIGEGTNIIGMIHIKDLTALNLLIFDVALAANEKPLFSSAYERFYIATFYDNPRHNIMRILTKTLFKQGLVQSVDLKHLNFEEDPEYNLTMAGNSQARGRRAYDLGWAPKESFFEDVAEEDILDALKLFSGNTFRIPSRCGRTN